MSQTLSPKRVCESAMNDQTSIVFPNDLNALGTLFGGRVLEKADLAAAIVAQRHAGRVCITLGVDSVRFLAPARGGDLLVLQSSVNRVWRTSMEVGVKASAEDVGTGARRHIFSAYFTYVGVDEHFQPTPIAPAVAESPDEVRRYEQAERRRQGRVQEKSKE